MNRRTFFNLMAIAGIGTIVAPLSATSGSIAPPLGNRFVLKGGRIGLIAPGSYIRPDQLDRAKQFIKGLGLEPYHTPNVLAREGDFGGTDKERLDELHHMFADDSIDAIWTVRGGYGVTRILDQLDFALIKNNPKPVLGFSDATALLLALHQATGNPCFHAPSAGFRTWTPYTREQLGVIFGEQDKYDIRLSESNKSIAQRDPLYKYEVITPGMMKGRLIGGSLTLISALVGTPHAMQAASKIIFLEDVGEQPYRIDRMLTQLLSAGSFKGAKGIVCGVFRKCKNDDDDKYSYTLQEVIKDRLGGLGIPVVYGFSFGHTKEFCTLPYGVMAEMDASEAILKIAK